VLFQTSLPAVLWAGLAGPVRHSNSNHRPFNSLQPLSHREKSQLLWNQANPASFSKTPGGVGGPRFAFSRHSSLATRHFLASIFRINTCKSVSKQRTLTLFGINTYEKTGEGGLHCLPRAKQRRRSPLRKAFATRAKGKMRPSAWDALKRRPCKDAPTKRWAVRTDRHRFGQL
jgi:hypothetical protein